ncbi:hypothetical protein [Cetobacterium sp.]|uniref:hypothetical protein n=1 Tax=Cetobacterium sp. TaxID=2071632 RepID=UPI002FCC334F
MKHKDYVILIAGVALGAFIPLAKVHLIGRTVGSKLPRKAAEQLADYLDAFEHGLRNKDYEGNKNIISNQQLSQETKKLKINLGLDQKPKEEI